MFRVIILILSFFSINMYSQTFNKRYHVSSPSSLFSSVLSTDTAYYVMGTRIDSVAPYFPEDFFLEIDLSGNITNIVTYKDSLASRYASWPTADFSGEYIKYAGSKSDAEGFWVTLSQINTQGEKSWEQQYEGFYLNQGESFMTCLDIVVDDAGNTYLLNNATSPSGYANTVIIKTDPNGNVLWQKATGVSDRLDTVGEIIIADDGNLYISACRWEENNLLDEFPYQNRIIKMDTMGNFLWDYLTPMSQGQIGRPYGIVEANDGGLIINSRYGYEGANGWTRYMEWEKYIYKLSPEGELVWELEIPSPWLSSSTRAWRMVKVSDGSGYVAIGSDQQYDGGEDSISLKGWLGKVDDNGNLLWSRKFVGINSLRNSHNLYDIKETSDGGFVAVGYSEDQTDGTLELHAWIIKTDEYGCLVPGCQLTSIEPTLEPEVKLSLYPNPVSDILNIWYADPDFQFNQATRFQIQDITGKIWQSFTSTENEVSLMTSVRDLPVGMYYLTCSSRMGSVPFVVKR